MARGERGADTIARQRQHAGLLCRTVAQADSCSRSIIEACSRPPLRRRPAGDSSIILSHAHAGARRSSGRCCMASTRRARMPDAKFDDATSSRRLGCHSPDDTGAWYSTKGHGRRGVTTARCAPDCGTAPPAPGPPSGSYFGGRRLRRQHQWTLMRCRWLIWCVRCTPSRHPHHAGRTPGRVLRNAQIDSHPGDVEMAVERPREDPGPVRRRGTLIVFPQAAGVAATRRWRALRRCAGTRRHDRGHQPRPRIIRPLPDPILTGGRNPIGAAPAVTVNPPGLASPCARS
jgi:hypothetical protein